MGHQERRTGLFSARTLGSFLGWALCSFLGSWLLGRALCSFLGWALCSFLGCGFLGSFLYSGFLGFKVLGSLRGFYLLFALLIVAHRFSVDQVR